MPALPSGINAASPLDSDDGTYLNFTADTTESLNRALDNMPSDFLTMQTGLDIDVVYRLSGTDGGDTHELQVRILDSGGTTVLAGASSTVGSSWQQVVADVTSTTDTTTTVNFTYTNTTANKATWDAAVVHLNQVFSQDMGPDGNGIQVDFVELAGDYAGVTNIDATAVLGTTTIVQPSISAGSNLSPSSIVGTATVPAPSVTAGTGSSITASAVLGTATIPQPTVVPYVYLRPTANISVSGWQGVGAATVWEAVENDDAAYAEPV